jgi:hypothetical protein
MSGIRRFSQAIACTSVMLLSSAASWGQGAVTQVLEEVVGFTDGAAIRVNRDDEATVISQLDVVGSDFRACELTAAGLVCLQGADIYLWDTPAPLEEGVSATATGDWLFSCADANLPFDTKKGGENSCTSATANAAGDAFVLGGKDNGRSNEIVHVVKSEVCPQYYIELDDYIDKDTGPEYCFKSLAPGRPLIITLELTKNDSSLPPGVLVLEERTRATLVEFDGTSTDLGDSKGWGLSGNERLTGITALRLDESFGPIAENDFILGTTTKNRIIALSTDAAAPGNFPVFDIQVSRDDRSLNSGDECVFEGPQSPISTGFKSGLVYVTDGLYCDLLVLKPVASSDHPFELSQDTVVDTQTATKRFALEGVTAAPGITINLATCESQGECNIVGEDIVLKNLQLASGSASSAIAYQIKNLPDCRYIPETCVQLEQFSDGYNGSTVDEAVAFLKAENVIVGAGDSPGGWQLNVKELLPAEVTDTVVIPDPFLISRFWRAPSNLEDADTDNDFIWEALFVDAKGVVVEDTFEITFDTFKLVTSGLAFDCEEPAQNPFEQHVLTTVSEHFFSGTGEYRDTMTNAPGCGSYKSFGGRTSLKSYSFVPTPCSVSDGVVSQDYIDWDSDGVCAYVGQKPEAVEVVDDAVFMKTLLSLWGDYGDVLRNFACRPGDDQSSGQPLLASDCTNSLIPTYENGTDKLAKCWDALRTPKQSAGDQNCSAWLSQTNNLRSKAVTATQNAPALDTSGFPDPANRKGELLYRIDVMLNLYYSRVVPSIPAAGFFEPPIN